MLVGKGWKFELEIVDKQVPEFEEYGDGSRVSITRTALDDILCSPCDATKDHRTRWALTYFILLRYGATNALQITMSTDKP